MDPSAERSVPDPVDPFETWLLHRVAEAVENREVSADLLTTFMRQSPTSARPALDPAGREEYAFFERSAHYRTIADNDSHAT